MMTTYQLEYLTGLLLLLIFVLTEAKPALKTSDDLSERAALQYLNKYGYISKVRQQNKQNTFRNGTNTLTTQSIPISKAEEMRLALIEFQKFMGIPVTGKLDAETLALMKKSRCAVPDFYSNERLSKLGLKVLLTTRGQRKRREAMQFFRRNGYSKTVLYEWVIDDSHRSRKYPRVSRDMIEFGCNLWSAVSNIDFEDSLGYPYVAIVFAFYKGDHGDGKPFDGPNGELAHASTQPKKVHFDDDEDWQFNHYHVAHMIRPGVGPDLVQLTAHEIGHVMGFKHSTSNKSIMYPTVNSGIKGAEYALAPEDIARVQAVYGKCYPPRIDAIFSNFRGNGRTYIIVGPFIYLFDDHKVAVDPNNWPRNAYHFWRAGFHLFDDIFHGDSDRLYYFSGKWYYYDIYNRISSWWWAIDKKDKGMNAGIVGWPGLAGKVSYIDAAFKHIDGRVYIFRGDKVYRWDFNAKSPYQPHFPPGHLEVGWPKRISEVFPGVPDNIDSAFRWNYDGKVYFFKGQYFYIWNANLKKAEGIYTTDQWKNVCNVYKCAGVDVSNYRCRSWALTRWNCGRMCERPFGR